MNAQQQSNKIFQDNFARAINEAIKGGASLNLMITVLSTCEFELQTINLQMRQQAAAAEMAHSIVGTNGKPVPQIHFEN